MSSLESEPSEIFKNAAEEFRSTLSDEEKRIFCEFPNAKSMIAALEEQARSHRIHQSRLTACCRKVNTLAVKLSPFFEVVNIFVQSHPEYSGIAWGAIRLVFQLGTNYISFLEKFSDMFENMGNLLPAYELYVRELRARAQQQNRGVSPRLLKALGYIYSDLIQFCFEACKLLSKKRSSIRLRGSFVSSLLWKPFDVKSDTLLRRYSEHRQLMDLEMKATSHAEAMEVSGKFDDMMARVEHQWEEQDERAREMECKEIDRRLQRLKEWINPPTWSELFEDAQNRRIPETSEWFLTDERVRRWCSRTSCRDSDESNILFVQGKPGFGKTTLCTALIENLRRTSTAQSDPQSLTLSSAVDVVFFYFDKQRRDCVQPTDAFRAVLTQLLPIDGGNKEAIDIASILWSVKHTGQLTASGDEIKSIIRLLPRHSRPFVIFLDGVDECVDQRGLFRSLEEICTTHTDCSLALFSRPTVQVPRRFMQHCVSIDLHSGQNLGDIRLFLRPKIRELVEDEVLAPDADDEDIATKISSRANGMFLWVTLLIEYLQSPALTIRQRSEAVDNLNRLEGLDGLYSAILRSLIQRSPEPARDNVRRAFQWVAWSYRPLHINELKYAIAIPIDRRMDANDVIPDFALSLSSVSGALLEVSSDMTVRFIHLSALEYFIGLTSAPDSNSAPPNQFSTDESMAHRHCAACCISYLCYSIPAEPMGGSAQTAADGDFQRLRYPFLEYAAEFWSHHLLRCTESLKPGKEAQTDVSIDQLMSLVSSFLSNQRTITMWIEASWIFNHPPQVGLGPEDKMLSETFSGEFALDREHRDLLLKAIEVLKHLAKDLTDLNNSWADVLRDTPNEVWEPSIPAFKKSQFWTAAAGAEVTPLRPQLGEADDFVCVKSQVSSSGLHAGLVKVRPPSRLPAVVGTLTPNLTRSCKVCYEVWSLASKTLVLQTTFEVPSSAFAPFLQDPDEINSAHFHGLGGKDGRYSFKFPTAISGDLRHTAILHYLDRIPEPRSLATALKPSQNYPAQFQKLDFSLSNENANANSFRFDEADFYEDYALQMSPTGEFLLVMHASSACVNLSDKWGVRLWLIRIYRDREFQSSSVPDYVYTASLAFKTPEADGRLYPERYIAFHPHSPVIALAYRGVVLLEHPWKKNGHTFTTMGADASRGTLLWDFSRKGIVPLEVSQEFLTDMRFSNDGSQIYGRLRANRVRISVPHDHRNLPSLRREPPSDTIIMRMSLDGRHSSEIAMSLSKGPVPTSQESNSLFFGRNHQGMTIITQLDQLAREGGLVLHRLQGNGVMTSETLARLPKSVVANSQAVLLDPFNNSDSSSVRVVLNQAMKTFNSHRGDEESEFFLPALLERKRDSITTFVGKGTYSLEDGMNFSGISHKRLGWTEESSNKRPRHG